MHSEYIRKGVFAKIVCRKCKKRRGYVYSCDDDASVKVPCRVTFRNSFRPGNFKNNFTQKKLPLAWRSFEDRGQKSYSLRHAQGT